MPNLTLPEIAELLRGNETFASAPEAVLADLAAKAEERAVAEGEILIEQGKRCGDVFMVKQGEFAVHIARQQSEASDGGSEEPPPPIRLGRGRVFGEIGAVSGIGATATVRALSPGEVLVIPGAILHQTLRQSPALAESVLRSLSRYLSTP